MAYPITANADRLSSVVPLRRIRLRDVVNNPRMARLLKLEAYYKCTQHHDKPYDWDGYFKRLDDISDIPSSSYVPMKNREPCARVDMPKIIVNALTSMVFGINRFPTIEVKGDSDAESYVQALSKESKLPLKMIEARCKGGSQGTAVLSWGFTDGKPTIEIHNAAFIEVLEWESYKERRPGKVLETYTYERKVWNLDGKPEYKLYYYARYWDENVTVCWEDITEEEGATQFWWAKPSKLVYHNAGFCPVYWIQNSPDSDNVDGQGDYDETAFCNFDGMDMLKSATTRGAIANVDPTLVIHDDIENNDGALRKGSENAIYSPKGAEYLELSGTAISASMELLSNSRQSELDKASVVILDPDKAGGTAISASAMKQRYAQMCIKSDVLREQYGNAVIKILTDMLEVSRRLKEMPRYGADGEQYWSKVILPPKITFEREDDSNEKEKDASNEREKRVVKKEEHRPGESSNISISWPSYFSPTWVDKKTAVETVQIATGGKQVLSQRAGVQALGTMFGTENTDQELGEIDADANRGVERAQAMMESGAPSPFPKKEEEEDSNDKKDNKP